jgi:hypothetical protein
MCGSVARMWRGVHSGEGRVGFGPQVFWHWSFVPIESMGDLRAQLGIVCPGVSIGNLEESWPFFFCER